MTHITSVITIQLSKRLSSNSELKSKYLIRKEFHVTIISTPSNSNLQISLEASFTQVTTTNTHLSTLGEPRGAKYSGLTSSVGCTANQYIDHPYHLQADRILRDRRLLNKQYTRYRYAKIIRAPDRITSARPTFVNSS